MSSSNKEKKSKKFFGFIVFFCIIVFALLFSVLLYFAGSFPQFNSFVDSFLQNEKIVVFNEEKIDEENQDILPVTETVIETTIVDSDIAENPIEIINEDISQNEENQFVVDIDSLVQNFVYPSEDVLMQIKEKMNNILSSGKIENIDSNGLYPTDEFILQINHQKLSPIIIFSPKDEGEYSVGLCNDVGEWVREAAFIVLFSKDGESKAVSLDYVADRPQISMHLSNSEIYYLCAGFMDTNERNIDNDILTSYFKIQRAF